MAQSGREAEAGVGGFESSFLITMIRDFFIILVLVTALEFALKAALVVYEFDTAGATKAAEVADEVAGNVRAIMLNEGGPVAARALYPILERKFDELGFLVAIEPTPVTVASIEEMFGFRPRGVPAEDWPEGRHNEARAEIRAEAFCQSCHVRAQIGDVLGVVTVRNYLDRDLESWWKSLQLSGALSMGKIVLHSLLLFLLLKARMAPLMRLRAVVGDLSRAFGGLNRRVAVGSRDEFGALSHDLNVFLDRISRIVADLDVMLRRVVTVNDDVMRLQSELRHKLDGFSAGVRRVERQAMTSARREPTLSAEWYDAMRAEVDNLRGVSNADPAAVYDKLSAVIALAERQMETNVAVFEALARLGEESETFRDDLAEMTRLEERMRGVIDTGAALLSRLRPGEEPAGAEAPAG